MSINPSVNPLSLSLALENALAQQRFEGLTPSISVISDLKQVIEGSLTIDDVIFNIGTRYNNVKILN